MGLKTEESLARRMIMLLTIVIIGVATVIPVAQKAINNAPVNSDMALAPGFILLFITFLLLIVFAQPLLVRRF